MAELPLAGPVVSRTWPVRWNVDLAQGHSQQTGQSGLGSVSCPERWDC